MKITVFLLLSTLLLASDSTISLLESLYENKEYKTLNKQLEKLSGKRGLSIEIRAAISRFKGHLCFFGMNTNYYIDLSCAWKNYAHSAQLGDPEGLFYTGLFLDNFLFNSLEPLKGSFGKDIDLIDKAKDLSAKVKAVKSLAFTMKFMSSTLGFPLALKYLGAMLKSDDERCQSAAIYYSRAAEKLLPHFNTSLQTIYEKTKEIHEAIHPFNSEEQYNDLHLFRYLEQFIETTDRINNSQSIINYLVGAYIEHREYKLAKQLAMKMLKKNVNNTFGNYALGMLYLIGEAVPINYTLALHHLRIAVQAKHGDSLNLLGYMYLKGLGVEQDTMKANDCFKEAANQGNRYGAYNQASITFNPKGLDGLSSAQMFLISLTTGIMQAFYNLGMMYTYGVGVPHLCNTGLSYLGIALDIMIQRKYFDKAYDTYMRGHDKAATMQYMVMAEIGNVSAQVSVGNLFDYNDQIKDKLWIHQYEPKLNINKRLALKYYMAAFNQGENVICVRIGDFYYYGYEVNKDLDMAMSFYNRSIAVVTIPRLYTSIIFRHGILRHYGIGLPQDYELASLYYNETLTMDASWYFPVKVMNTVMAYEWIGIREVLPSFNIYFLLISVALFATTLFLFLKKNQPPAP